jgi:hypothetical protein
VAKKTEMARRWRTRLASAIAVMLVAMVAPHSPLEPQPVAADDPPPSPPPALDYAGEVAADSPLSWFRLNESATGVLADSQGFDATASTGQGATAGEPGLVADGGTAVRGGPAPAVTSSGAGLPAGGAARSLEAWIELPCGAAGCLVEAGAAFDGASPTVEG